MQSKAVPSMCATMALTVTVNVDMCVWMVGPEFTSIIAIGDFGMEIEQVVNLIKDKFNTQTEAPLPMPLSPYTDMMCPDHPEPLFSVFHDKEITESVVTVETKFRSRPLKTYGDFKRMLRGLLEKS